MKHALLVVVALAAVGCKKDKGAEQQGSGIGTASASGTGTASASGTGTASASGTGTASASGTGTGAAIAIDAGAAPTMDAAEEAHSYGRSMPDSWYAEGAGCSKVVERIAGCAKEKVFLDALIAGAEPDDAKEQKTRAKAVGKWSKHPDKTCSEMTFSSYEDEGFLSIDWGDLASDDLADCAKLGAAIHEHEGLPGGAFTEDFAGE